MSIETALGAQRYPRAVFEANTGTQYTVVYEDDRNLATTKTDIYARRVQRATGTVGAAFAVATTADPDLAPHIAWRGASDHEVVWYRDPSAFGSDLDVWGQTVVAGAVSGAAYSVAADVDVRETTPTLVCGDATTCFCAYERFDDGDGIDRIKARVVTFP